jgi:hypothetical protein
MPKPTPDNWKALIQAAGPAVNGETRPKAMTPLWGWGTASKPVLVSADNNQLYVIKGVQVGRPLFTDHVVARVGVKMEAPVARPAIVQVTDELAKGGGWMAPFVAGPAHATSAVAPLSKDRELQYAHLDHAANRSRFALVAMLYGWCQATDHQFLYGTPPLSPVVISVDHGHFFGGMGWTVASLKALPPAKPDGSVVAACALDSDELKAARAALELVKDADIAFAVACPPDAWKVTSDDRIGVAAWLWDRRDQLLNG